ncbi:MAG TPA: hypothetical protein PKA38_02935 [Candidatus Levybacteria bacterium]|nr:hypothetical protein [Candidatus Levybacteria bacterium]
MVEKEANYHSSEESLSPQSNSQRLFKKAVGLYPALAVNPLIERAKFQIKFQEHDLAHQTLKLIQDPNESVGDIFIQLSSLKIGEGNTDEAITLLDEAVENVKKTKVADPYGLMSDLVLSEVVDNFAKIGKLDRILSVINVYDDRDTDRDSEIVHAANELARNGYEMQAIQAASLLEEKKKPSVLRRIENIKLGKDDSELVKNFRDLDGTSDDAKLCALLADSEMAFESGNLEHARELLTLFTKEYSPNRNHIELKSERAFFDFAVEKMGETDLELTFLDKLKPDIEIINAYCDVAKAQFLSENADSAKATVSLSKVKLGEMLENKALETYRFDAELDIIATQIAIGEADKAFDRLDKLAPELAREDLTVLIGELFDRGNIDLIPFLINLSKEPMVRDRFDLVRELVRAGRMSEGKEQLEIIHSNFNSIIDKCRSKISSGRELSIMSGMSTASLLCSELSRIHQMFGDRNKAQELVEFHHEFVRSSREFISEKEYNGALWVVLSNTLRIQDYDGAMRLASEFQSGVERSKIYNYLARNLSGEDALRALKRAEEEANSIGDEQLLEKSSAYLSISNSYYQIEKMQRIYNV